MKLEYYKIGLDELIEKLSAWKDSHKEIADMSKVKVEIVGRDCLQIFPNQYCKNFDNCVYFPKEKQ